MSKQLHELVETVVDEESFVAFLLAMSEDYVRSSGIDCPLAWQSDSIDSMLEAAAAWASETRNTAHQTPNPWQRCAEIIWAGKHYE